MADTKYIDNDELYRTNPHAHEVAINSFESVTEVSYPAVEGWIVTTDSHGNVEGIVEPIFADWYKKMTQYKIRGYISKDGSQRHSQVSSVKLMVDAMSDQEALNKAKALIAEKTGQTVLEVWIPVRTAHAVLDALDALDSLYTDEDWGDRDLGEIK